MLLKSFAFHENNDFENQLDTTDNIDILKLPCVSLEKNTTVGTLFQTYTSSWPLWFAWIHAYFWNKVTHPGSYICTRLLLPSHSCQMIDFPFNSLWPGDAIWSHGTRSTLAQVMACCLTAPSHYLNQCWLIIPKVHWHSYEGNLTLDALAINH